MKFARTYTILSQLLLIAAGMVLLFLGALLIDHARRFPFTPALIVAAQHLASTIVAGSMASLLGLGAAIHLSIRDGVQRGTRLFGSLVIAPSRVPAIVFGLSYIFLAQELALEKTAPFILITGVLFFIQLPRAVDLMYRSLSQAPPGDVAAAVALGASPTAVTLGIRFMHAKKSIISSLLAIYAFGFQCTAAVLSLDLIVNHRVGSDNGGKHVAFPHLGLDALALENAFPNNLPALQDMPQLSIDEPSAVFNALSACLLLIFSAGFRLAADRTERVG